MLLALLLSLLSLPPDTGWTPLFDGRTLNGWSHVGDGRFVVERGMLRTVGGMGLLWYSARPFDRVQLRVVYRADGSNSGVFVRIPSAPANPYFAVDHGYEVQIDDSAGDWHCTGTLYSFTRALARPGRNGWNTLLITLDGPHTRVAVNGVLVTDYTEGQPVRRRPWWTFWQWWQPAKGPRPWSGFIGLQNHGRGDVVLFREVSVRPLPR